MMAKRQRRRKGPLLHEHGHPIMAGVDMSMAEDPAKFWGKHWEGAFDDAEESARRGEGRVSLSTEEFIA